ncbi:MAG: hypothetical protein NUV73_01820 [Candidatus Daviesbacteria bacterium]|nr:hypothetical protein [Candidatus Daviesbacteria bacterium]
MFSKKEAIKFGWNITKKHFWLFVLILLTSFGIQMIPNLFQLLVGKNQELTATLVLVAVSIIASVFKLMIDLGIIKITLNLVDNQPVKYGDLFKAYGIIKYFIGTILYSLIILGGSILLIIPGIIFGIRFQYYTYFIVDKGLGPIEALKQSWGVTRGRVWNLFIFGVLLTLLNIAGALLLGIGLLFTVPTSMVAMAYVFKKLQNANTSDQVMGTGKFFLLASLGLLMFIIPMIAIILINPLELTKKARDAARLSDLTNLEQLINQAQTNGIAICPTGQLYCEGSSNKGSRETDGIGWVKVPLTGIIKLPIDPSNSSEFFYQYCSNGTDWEIEARLESKDVAKETENDNGDNPKAFEVGSDLTICRLSS